MALHEAKKSFKNQAIVYSENVAINLTEELVPKTLKHAQYINSVVFRPEHVFYGCAIIGHRYILDLVHDEICKDLQSTDDFFTPLLLLTRSV